MKNIILIKEVYNYLLCVWFQFLISVSIYFLKDTQFTTLPLLWPFPQPVCGGTLMAVCGPFLKSSIINIQLKIYINWVLEFLHRRKGNKIIRLSIFMVECYHETWQVYIDQSYTDSLSQEGSQYREWNWWAKKKDKRWGTLKIQKRNRNLGTKCQPNKKNPETSN